MSAADTTSAAVPATADTRMTHALAAASDAAAAWDYACTGKDRAGNLSWHAAQSASAAGESSRHAADAARAALDGNAETAAHFAGLAKAARDKAWESATEAARKAGVPF